MARQWSRGPVVNGSLSDGHKVSVRAVLGGAEAIPALTAIRKVGESPEILHGHAAARARKRNPDCWTIFAYPKQAFMDKETTSEIQRTLEHQKEKAEAFGMPLKEIATAFFRHMISEVVGGRDEMFKIYINISDRWPNSNVQELMLSFQELNPNARFENVDECLSSIVGRIFSDAGSQSAGGVYVVADCGHSTMSVGLAEVAEGPKYKVHRYEEHAAGAGEINMAVEDGVRAINRANGAKSSETNVWEVSQCIDELYKPQPEEKITAQCGFSDHDWNVIMERAKLENLGLDRHRSDLTRQTLTDALGLADRLGNNDALNVLLTGRGSRSPTLQRALRDLMSQEFPAAILHEDPETHITAVLAGLMCIADDPNILSVQEVPVSLWLRSDPDERTTDEDRNTVIRICTQGQDKTDISYVQDRLSASHPIHYELSAADDGPLSLDLSVFGTPNGVSDETIIKGWNADKFACADLDKVTEFGRFEQRLPESTPGNGKELFHVYVYIVLSRLSVELYAVFAHDGRAVKLLEKTPFDEAFHDGELFAEWRTYRGVEMDIIRLKQVARPEGLSANAPTSHLLGDQQPDPSSGGIPSSNTSAGKSRETQVGHRPKKRARKLPPRAKALRQQWSELLNTSDTTSLEQHG